MKAADLFTIILKVLGIYLIKDLLLSIPPVLYSLHSLMGYDAGVAFFSLFISLLVFGINVTVVYLLLFRTGWLISNLRLTADLSESPLAVNLHRSTVYTIAIIISGIVILTLAIPKVVRHFYAWYNFVDSRNTRFINESYDYGPLLISLTEVLIGLLFLGSQRTIVNFIELRRRDVNRG